MSQVPNAPRTVLIVAYYFPPIATSGAMRPLGFCRYLREHGYAVRVVAADGGAVTPALATDGGLAGRLPPDVVVDRVGHPDPLRRLLRVRDWITRRSGARTAPGVAGTGAATARPAPSWLRSLADTLIEHLFLFPDPQRPWFRGAVAAAQRGTRPDVVFATGGPWTTLLVGRALARRYGVPFVADFRDPWSRNPFRAFRWLVRPRSRRLERAICRDAALVIANTDELRAQFAADYPWAANKLAVITNGFDLDAPATMAPAVGLPPTHAGVADDGRCELWHFGTIYGKRTPLELLAALKTLVERDPLATARLHVHFVGAWELGSDDPATRLARWLEVAGLVTRRPPVPHDACLALMRRAGALLVIQPDSPLQVPGKIFEYLATGRPLVVVGGEGATAELVRRHQLGQCVPNSTPAIVDLLGSWVGGTRTLPAGRRHEPFAYRHLAGQLAGAFDRAVGAHAVAR